MVVEVSPLEIEAFVKVVVAALLAGLVGLERERAAKPAGFRTHMILGGASALLVMLGLALIDTYPESEGTARSMRYDPLRVIEAIIVGVSFIGAGTILKVEKEERIKYLTTAASLLFAAGIGICTAVGLYYLAGALAVLVVVINQVLNWIERRFIGRGQGG